MGLLEGKIAIITGAGTGMGRATAALLAHEGAQVVLVGRRQEVLDEVAVEIIANGGVAFPRAADISSNDDVDALIGWVEENAGPVGTCHLTVQAEALRRPLEEASRELGTQPRGDEALFLWNAFFDPRELFDLIRTVGLTPEQASRRLVLTYTAALRGWSDGRT